MTFRFHVLGIPHTISNKEYVACAFTQKVVKFCDMMKARGHTIIHYGHENSVVACDENVAVTNDAVLEAAYGGHDWRANTFKYDLNDTAYAHFYKHAIEEIGKRKQKGDFLLCFWGWGHKAIADAHSDLLVVEPGIGYPGGVFAPYRVFESQSIMAAWFNMKAVSGPGHFSWYDAVIPNYFDLNDFDYSEEKDDYFLYLGRIGEHKGVHIAIQVCQAIGAKLKIAGQGSIAHMGYATPPEGVEVIGYADVETRRKLMSRARGQFVCTLYGEPFGGVQIESMLSGTPVISTDWACFGELNLHGVTGYRCRTFEQLTWAASNIHKINPKNCREWAAKNFNFDKIGNMYEEFFYSISRVHDGSRGWYEPNPGRTDLDWLKRDYPSHPGLE
jgi:glycosyltransferase involved in cell wall biosynthesis